jgi:transposase-like protein
MPRAIPRDPIYRRRRYSAEIIEQCVRWYITYRLSYRDLVAIEAERGVAVSHTTILRWVQRYVPEYERRWARFSRPPGQSWRMDETQVAVRGQPHWLYRAVDRNGKSVHSLLCVDRTIESAKAFFQAAVARPECRWPVTINLDGNAATYQSLRQLSREDPRWKAVTVRANRYLNNRVEQDHRAVKQRCASMLGLKGFGSAEVTFRGIELAHRIRKGQFHLPTAGQCPTPSLLKLWDFALRLPGDRELPAECGAPLTHQSSANGLRPRHRRARKAWPRRFPLKVPYGRGLYLLVTPSGGRGWRFRYRYHGKQTTLSLGPYPYVSVQTATMRHLAARQWLASGVDPAARKSELHRLSPVPKWARSAPTRPLGVRASHSPDAALP